MAKKKEKKMMETVLPVEIPGQSNNYIRSKSKFEVYGEEMIEKEVKLSGNSGRVYLPPEWVGKHVKIIRID
jgi:putative transposon-encoded protein